jgi:hypothetical protein
MDPIWRNLPVELVYKICNFLPRVRWVNPDLKNEMIYNYKRRLYDKILGSYDEEYGGMYYNPAHGRQRARDLMAADMYDILNEYNESPQTHWLLNNMYNAWALFRSMSEEQVAELAIGV